MIWRYEIYDDIPVTGKNALGSVSSVSTRNFASVAGVLVVAKSKQTARVMSKERHAKICRMLCMLYMLCADILYWKAELGNMYVVSFRCFCFCF